MEPYDEPFYVQHGDYSFQVIPNTGTEPLDSEFLVLLGGVKVGDLTMDENEQWQWNDSNMTDADAEAIGRGIESHYD
ncbi:hypothetical protein ACFSJU_14870 [Paradesertivirga mongoliensis]|uniref:Uncharacterized protein n=1 Tax=Paradesertivirga mongoliensis TaxID=2100740 RepID=A0ABW4ZPN6_9SPHI|nr:hypothetical protein [Pedobacter mongoliensis]